jgi:hypothetical protein
MYFMYFISYCYYYYYFIIIIINYYYSIKIYYNY